jgi:hypothetical protein
MSLGYLPLVVSEFGELTYPDGTPVSYGNDPWDDPMLFLRNPVEGRCWKRARQMVKPRRGGVAKYVRRKAHKKARKAARECLLGVRPRHKARPGSGWDIS